MVYVTTNHGSGGPEERDDRTRSADADLTEHCACCVLALLGVGGMAIVTYPALVGLTRPLHVLSSTAIVSTLVVGWLLLWFSMEVLWEWRARRRRSLRI